MCVMCLIVDSHVVTVSTVIQSVQTNRDAYLTKGCLVCSSHRLLSRLWPGTPLETMGKSLSGRIKMHGID